MLLQQLANGVMLGSTYALVAIGYALVFGVLRVLHLAHGEVFMVGAFVGVQLVILLNVGPFVALIGGLVGAAIAAAGLDAVNWGGLEGLRPVGVVGILVVLATSPLVGALAAVVVLRLFRRILRRGTRRFSEPVRDAQWVTSALLSVGQGANDAQKAVGVVAAVLLADGVTSSLESPLWVTVAAALAMAAGSLVGGWRIVRTIGRRIYDLRPLDALASQTGSAAAILGASIVGAPISSTHVVSSSVVGAGLGRRRFSRIRWSVVRQMGIAWVTTVPATALVAAALVLVWESLA